MYGIHAIAKMGNVLRHPIQTHRCPLFGHRCWTLSASCTHRVANKALKRRSTTSRGNPQSREAKQAALQEELSNKQQEAEEARRQLGLAKSESAEQSKPLPTSGQTASALAGLPEAHLVVTHGPKRLIGTKYRLVRQRNRVGAANNNDVVISVPAVSGTHMEIQIFPSGDIFVQDLNSTNGTFIDSVKMAPGARTQDQRGSPTLSRSECQNRINRRG